MKGLFFWDEQIPGRRRYEEMATRQGAHSFPEEKSKSQEQLLPAKEDEIRTTNVNGEVLSAAEILSTEISESEEELPRRQPTKAQEIRPICYDGDKATVTLQLKQMVALDGWPMVFLVVGQAAIHSYALSPGVEVLLCSNSKLAAVIAIESQLSSQAVKCLPRQGGVEDDPSLSQSSEMSDIHEKPAAGADTFGCTLEFQSYREGSAEIGSGFDAINGGKPFSKRTFRAEIALENESLVQNDVQKRKRDQENVVDEDEMSSSGDDEEGCKDLKIEGMKSVLDLADMEVDDLLDVGSPDRKKPRKELRKV